VVRRQKSQVGCARSPDEGWEMDASVQRVVAVLASKTRTNARAAIVPGGQDNVRPADRRPGVQWRE